MAQKSIFWQTGTAGDGSSEYTQAEVIQWQREHWINDTTDEGIFKNYESALEVSGTATPVNVGTGAACVYGFHYWNTANISTAIPSPGTGTRIDRLVLQADWTNRQVRLARLPGVTFGGTAAPVALTQMDGTTWEIPLAQLSITTGGAITVTDERVMLHPNIEVETAMIQNSAVTTAKINNDAIDDTKAGNRIIQLYRRQGGSANDWGSTGTTTYTPTTIREQVGSIRHTVSGTSARQWTVSSKSVNFPTPFSHTPMVHLTLYNPGVGSTALPFIYYISDCGTGSFDLALGVYSDQSLATDVWWRAIGPE